MKVCEKIIGRNERKSCLQNRSAICLIIFELEHFPHDTFDLVSGDFSVSVGVDFPIELVNEFFSIVAIVHENVCEEFLDLFFVKVSVVVSVIFGKNCLHDHVDLLLESYLDCHFSWRNLGG